MKTRTIHSGSAPGSSVSNGCGGPRKGGRISSSDNLFAPLSPRTRSGIKQEIDDEVSFT
jgi:hypothetical protein